MAAVAPVIMLYKLCSCSALYMVLYVGTFVFSQMKRVYLRCVNESQCYFWRSNEVWFHCVRAVSSCGYQPVLPKRGHYYAITFLICETNKPVSIYPCTFNLNGNKIFLICVWFGIMQLTPISYSIISLQPAWIKKKLANWVLIILPVE